MSRSLLALLVPLALLSAGCLGAAEEDVTPAAAADDAPAPAEPAADPAPSPAPASTVEAEAGSSPQTETAPAPVVVPLSFEGSMPHFVQPCAWTGATGGFCQVVSHGEAFRNRFEVEETGNATALRLTLTWTPSSPLMERLSVSFHSFTEDEFVEHARAFGTSPLVLELGAPVHLPEGWTHRLGVGASYSGVAPLVASAGAYVGTEQAFTLEGTLTLSG